MGDERVSVSFACQRCLQPIVLDDSFSHMSVHALAELACKFKPLKIIIYYVNLTNHIYAQCPFTPITMTLIWIHRPLALII